MTDNLEKNNNSDLQSMYDFCTAVRLYELDPDDQDDAFNEKLLSCARHLMEADIAAGYYYMEQLYEDGKIIPKDIDKAVSLYIEAGRGGWHGMPYLHVRCSRKKGTYV